MTLLVHLAFTYILELLILVCCLHCMVHITPWTFFFLGLDSHCKLSFNPR